MPCAIAMFDRDMRYLAASRRWCADHRIPPGAIATGRCHDDISSDIPQRWKQARSQALAGATVQIDDESFSPNTVRAQSLRAEIRPWYDDRGGVGGIVITTEAAADRDAARHDPARSESQLAAELAVMHRLWRIGITRIIGDDATALVDDIVNAAIEITGAAMSGLQVYDHAAVALKLIAHRGFDGPLLDYFSPAHRDRAAYGNAINLRARVIVEDAGPGRVTHGAPELDILRKARVGTVCSTPLLTRAGAAIGVLTVCFHERHALADHEVRGLDLLAQQAADVLEQVRSHNHLREQRDYLSAILTAAVDAVITIDGRGIIQSVNPATERMFGYAASDMVGANVSMLMPDPYRGEHDQYIERHLSTGESRVIGKGREVRALRKDGTEFPAELSVSRADHHDLFVGIVRDITASTQAEQKIRESERLASIGTLAAGLGHDMNNVLLPVRARLNALMASDHIRALPASQIKHVDEIEKSIAYLQHLADGLHFLTLHPEAGKDARNGESVTDLRLWWSQVAVLLKTTVPRHVRLSASIPADVPPVAIAAHGLTQAVLNLFVNSAKAIPGPTDCRRRQGHIRLWAKCCNDRNPPLVRLGVTDNGPGMTQEVQRRAFDMFFTTKPRGLGTGLGLALVRRVIEQAGGSVKIESEFGKGTTVIMDIPAAVQAPHAADARHAVLSVHDVRAATLIRQVLESAGMSVMAADAPDHAHLWVVDPASLDCSTAMLWKRRVPDGRLVLLGRPPEDIAANWELLAPDTIDAPNDFESVLAAIRRAMAS